MAACRSTTTAVAVVVLAIFVVTNCGNNLQSACAMRVLRGDYDQWMKGHHNLLVQSLPRGRLPPSGANPCTRIPGGKRGRCTLEGHKAERPAAAIPGLKKP